MREDRRQYQSHHFCTSVGSHFHLVCHSCFSHFLRIARMEMDPTEVVIIILFITFLISLYDRFLRLLCFTHVHDVYPIRRSWNRSLRNQISILFAPLVSHPDPSRSEGRRHWTRPGWDTTRRRSDTREWLCCYRLTLTWLDGPRLTAQSTDHEERKKYHIRRPSRK